MVDTVVLCKKPALCRSGALPRPTGGRASAKLSSGDYQADIGDPRRSVRRVRPNTGLREERRGLVRSKRLS
jgi:hypothetical protein